jgi:integrase
VTDLAVRLNNGECVVRVRLRGINTVHKKLANGTVKIYHYHRATGTRLDGEPGSPEFIASYGQAEKIISDRLSGCFNALVRDYTLSIEFQQNLADSTKKEYRRMLTAAEVEFGDLPIAALNEPGVRQEFLHWREETARSSGNREADNRLSAISAMLTWAVDRGRIVTNHLKGFRRLYHSDRAEIIWLPEHIHSFKEVAPVELQRALLLALHTGQREGDLLRLPWTAYDGTTIRLRQGKSRRGRQLGPLIEIPCTGALRQMLDSMERVSTLILTTKTGRAFKKRYFLQCWSHAMKKAGLETVQFPNMDEPVRLHFHDLRGTTVTLLSEAGCIPQQIATITGHSLATVSRILERYLARTRELAEQAIFNFENSPRTKFANQLQTDTSAGTNANKK